MAVEAIRLGLTWVVIRVIVREIIMVGPTIGTLPSTRSITVTVVSQFKIDVIVVEVVETNPFLLVPS